MSLKIWRIWQDEDGGYDSYDSAVVIAEDEASARQIHPHGGNDQWIKSYAGWASTPDNVNAELIGEALPGAEIGVVVASFNAG